VAKLNIKEIRAEALRIVKKNPGGIRFGQLLGQIQSASPETPSNTIQGSIWNLDTVMPTEVKKPSRGLYQPVATMEPTDVVAIEAEKETKLKEHDFYAPFADWLKNDLDEVTDVVALGGAALKSKC